LEIDPISKILEEFWAFTISSLDRFIP
jgi:hypothetical protein